MVPREAPPARQSPQRRAAVVREKPRQGPARTDRGHEQRCNGEVREVAGADVRQREAGGRRGRVAWLVHGLHRRRVAGRRSAHAPRRRPRRLRAGLDRCVPSFQGSRRLRGMLLEGRGLRLRGEALARLEPPEQPPPSWASSEEIQCLGTPGRQGRSPAALVARAPRASLALRRRPRSRIAAAMGRRRSASVDEARTFAGSSCCPGATAFGFASLPCFSAPPGRPLCSRHGLATECLR
mmetsp:Transcript_12623/g.36224  ORF Transcript_12623/g.36224 Transcript_12623/m.36224 type:complete len:238 (+) Transcript_12623:549-1262(+)